MKLGSEIARWSEEKANRWWKKQPRLCGFNYLPRTAVNWNEMWAEETFDVPTIAQELSWAKSAGFNCLRTNLPFVEWQKDSGALISRVDTFLSLCVKQKIKVILTLLDDCEFGGEQAHTGQQKPPLPNVHNSRAMGSPGRRLVMDTSVWSDIEQYVTDIVGQFGSDGRVLMWDLYNEPTNRMIFTPYGEFEFSDELEQYSHSLAEHCFYWARKVGPEQPLTIGAWHVPSEHAGKKAFLHPTDQMCLNLSDVVTFHAYVGEEDMTSIIAKLIQYNRPMMCTEWLARHCDSTYESILPLMQKYSIGVTQWGLVRGKTQTSLPWPSINVGTNNRDTWFHDFLDEDGTPYSQQEVQMICRFTSGDSINENV
ncbi:hypothetical protein VINI7043_19153 [Vibrio nigripulchritudo ATCC 27043]|uniref:cellulase family glycosylhydrolase n=1 Tax=Vibrio nigripulchritudo TaxID=28173 RepID=UPI00021C31B8|nr:cellulase family glycosylhydrolase [Vibrio nigripulchritudo]EGU56107.1 hypothetical protein VINI7043_19153 [Vibrio nigripulchritudo ATCC 27043]